MELKDDMGEKVALFPLPQRIVSLVPSITELLFYLGLGDRVVGVTRYCIFPQMAQESAQIIGGTKDVDIESVRQLKPDLIIANKEENIRDAIEELKTFSRVYVSDVESREEGLRFIENMGILTGTVEKAVRLIKKINKEWETVSQVKERVAYFIWNSPYMSVNQTTYIHDMLDLLGLENVFAHREERYPMLTISDLKEADPQTIFLSSEPYPFSKKHAVQIKQILPNANIVFVDGTYFSWFGCRMASAPAYFNKLLKENF